MRTPLLLLTVAISTSPLLSQTTEGFETGYTAGATTFNGPTGETFLLTSDLRITNFDTYGAGGSDWFIDTGILEGNDNMPASQIVLQDVLKTFTLESVKMWTSGTDGSSYAVGFVTLTGTGPGGNVSHIFTVAPTGNSGLDWVELSMNGTLLQGAALQTITITYGSTLNYVSLDDLTYTIGSLVGIEETSALQRVSLFPFIATDLVNVDLGAISGRVQTRILDELGRLITTHRSVGGSTTTIPVDRLAKGAYLLELTTEAGDRKVLRFTKD